jgi:hypothetical protein
MTERGKIGLYAGIWIVLLAVTLIVASRRRRGVGLTGAFLLNYMARHWLGSVIYLLPWHPVRSISLMTTGLEQSLWGMFGFAFGSVILSPALTGPTSPHETDSASFQESKDLNNRIKLYLIVGAIFYFLSTFSPFLGQIPTLSTLLEVANRFAVLAVCLLIQSKLRVAFGNAWRVVILSISAFVLFDIVFRGFLNYAALVATFLITFYLSYERLDLKKIVGVVCVVYLGLSGSIVYMENRSAIREQVWGGGSFLSRGEAIIDTVRDFKVFSPTNPDHLREIDHRLNRDYYIGLAASNINAGLIEYAYGMTFLDAMMAPIPRILWPGKPRMSGDNTLTSRFTGIQFPSTTVAGSGLLFESFVNFGPIGVLMIFAFLGALLQLCDRRGRDSLENRQYISFALWTLPFLDLLRNESPMSSIIASALFTILVFKVWQYFIERSEINYDHLFLSRESSKL